MTDRDRIETALSIANASGQVDGDHHKAWVIDQMVRALTGCPIVKKCGKDWEGKPWYYDAFGESKEYKKLIAKHKDGADGPETYGWDEGIPP